MPKCKNDSYRNYKGDEPSPKGLGYCAHAEKEGSKKKGKDGNLWEVKTTKSGIKRWVKNSHVSKGRKYLIDGEEFVFGEWEPYYVIVNGKEVSIYTIEKKILNELNQSPPEKRNSLNNRQRILVILERIEKYPLIYYTRLLKKLNVSRVLTTNNKNSLEPVTMLLELKNSEYVIIGRMIVVFKITGDKIKKIEEISPSSRYSFPVAFGENYTYFLRDYDNLVKIHNDKLPKKYTYIDLEKIYFFKKLPDGKRVKLENI